MKRKPQRHGNSISRRFAWLIAAAGLLLAHCGNESSNNSTVGSVQSALGTDLAFGKTVVASSTAGGTSAAYAVDGTFGSGSQFWSSENEAAAWLRVDLGAQFNINTVELWNRGDGCCQDRLKDFYIDVSADGVTWVPSGLGLISTEPDVALPSRYSLGGLTARYVRLSFTTPGYKHVGELKVFGSATSAPPVIDLPHEVANLAALNANGGSITVSATEGWSNPNFAIDGNPSSSWTGQAAGEGFVELDLGRIFDVRAVQLLNRGDGCCAERLEGFFIETSLDGSTWSTLPKIELAPSHQTPTTYTVEHLARYVRVRDDQAGQFFHLAEIKVFAYDEVATGKSVDASSEAGGFATSYAVDGLYGLGTPSWSSVPDGDPWIQVDLGQNHELSVVRLWNRGDGCCAERLQDFSIEVSEDGLTWSDSGLGLITSAPSAADASDYRLNYPEARFVRVHYSVDFYSHLGEIQVFGKPLGQPFTRPQLPNVAAAAHLSSHGGSIQVPHTAGGFSPSYVNDGNVTTSWSSESWGDAYLGVDLGREYDLAELHLYNRGDGCCADRLRGFYIETSNDGVTWNAVGDRVDVAPSHLTPSVFSLEQRARYVRVREDGNGYLHVGEIEIYAYEGAPDLDVLYVERTPHYAYDAPKNEPDPNDPVVFTAHVKNSGDETVGTFSYSWYLDGVEIGPYSAGPIAAGDRITLDLPWTWDPATHDLRFVVDDDDAILELSESNNQRAFRTNALMVGLWVEQSAYDRVNDLVLRARAGTTSWEDMAQRWLDAWNGFMAASVHPTQPQGVLDRVRLERVTVIPDGTMIAPQWPANDNSDMDLIWGFDQNMFVNPDNTISIPNMGGIFHYLMHELSHARYLIDLYGLGLNMQTDLDEVLVTKLDGSRLQPQGTAKGYSEPGGGGMMSGISDPPERIHHFSEHDVMAWNLKAGQRNRTGNANFPGDTGDYLAAVPAENKVLVLDAYGQPLSGATINVFQSVTHDVTPHFYDKLIDNIVDITDVTGADGKASMGSNPFDHIMSYWTEIDFGIAIIQVIYDTQEFYYYLYISEVNKAYGAGNTLEATYTLQTNIFPF